MSRKTLHPVAKKRCRITLPPARRMPLTRYGQGKPSEITGPPGLKAAEKPEKRAETAMFSSLVSTASTPAWDARL